MFYPFYFSSKTKILSLEKIENAVEILPKLSDGTDGRWRWGKETAAQRLNELTAELVSSRNEYDIFQKDYLFSDKRIKPKSVWLGSEFAAEAGTLQTKALLGKGVFDTPKSIDLIKYCLEQATREDDIILDFFSGSATTAHAVMQLNAEDGGNRRFIMVQLPEVCDKKSEAFKAGYPNICEIGKERIRRAGKKIIETLDGDKPSVDVGFKVFKLDTSNMKIWDDTPIEDGDLETLFDRIDGHIDGLKPDRSDEDLIFEILLKMGYPLTADLTADDVDGLTVYQVDSGKMLVCLQEGITAEHIEQMTALSPQKIVLAGRGLVDSSAKANAFYLLENKGIELKTV